MPSYTAEYTIPAIGAPLAFLALSIILSLLATATRRSWLPEYYRLSAKRVITKARRSNTEAEAEKYRAWLDALVKLHSEGNPPARGSCLTNLFFSRLAALLFYTSDVAKPEYDEALANLFKLIETIKLVTVFLLILSPLTMQNYTCTLPPQLMQRLDVGTIAMTYDLPCDTGQAGFQAFLSDRGIALGSVAFAQLDEILSMTCGITAAYGYYGLILLAEALSLVFVFSAGTFIFQYPVGLCIYLYLTALAWSIWPVLLGFNHNGGFVCRVLYSSLTTAVFGILYSIMPLLVCLVSLLNGKRDATTETWRKMARDRSAAVESR